MREVFEGFGLVQEENNGHTANVVRCVGVDLQHSWDSGDLAWISITVIMIWWMGVDFYDSGGICDLVWICMISADLF